MQTTKTFVSSFLDELKTKIGVFQIVFEDRTEFKETLKKLELTVSNCVEIIKALTYENYFEGPIDDTIRGNHYWVFGVMIKGIEIYIKINKGRENKSVICISFHEAKFKIKYPLKGK